MLTELGIRSLMVDAGTKSKASIGEKDMHYNYLIVDDEIDEDTVASSNKH